MLDGSALPDGLNWPIPIPGVFACGDCDRLYLAPRDLTEVTCTRCDGQLADGGRLSFEPSLALVITGILLFLIACAEPLMTVTAGGGSRVDYLITGPFALADQGFWMLVPLIIFLTVLAPALRFGSLAYVLMAMHRQWQSPHVALAMRTAQTFKSWAMLDVFLVGAFVAFTRLRDLVQVDIGMGGYALVALVPVTMILDDVVANQLVWRRLPIAGDAVVPTASSAPRDRMTCRMCGLVSAIAVGAGEAARVFCRRCGTALKRRKPDSVARTWALVIAAAVLYLPANLLPVMTVVRFGRSETDTIMSGVRALIENDLWPLAAIVFLASIVVPVLKLSGLALLLISIQFRWITRLHDRTRLYRVIEVIGRWSNIDVFSVSVLAALVNFGTLSTVKAGPGIVPFALVVLLTMFASRSFDARLLWDAAEADR